MCILVQDSESRKERMAADKVTLEQQEAPPSLIASRHASSASQGDFSNEQASARLKPADKDVSHSPRHSKVGQCW